MTIKIRIKMTAAAAALLMGTLTAGQVWAFSDVEAGQSAAITSLQEKGVISGVDSEHFAPKQAMTYAQAMQLLVRAYHLNLDGLNFFKEPLPSDMYTKVKDGVWYSDAFVIGYYHGLRLDKDVDPNAPISRESFANLLVRGLEPLGNFPMVKMYIPIQDEGQIQVDLQGSVQRLLYYKAATLDASGRFMPKADLTRGDAATWVYKALEKLGDEQGTDGAMPPEPSASDYEQDK
jgi:hypothetical protein